MRAITSVIVDNVFLTFCILQAGPPKRCRARGNLTLPTLHLDGLGALITR